MLINELKKGVAYMQIKNKFFDSVKKVVENENAAVIPRRLRPRRTNLFRICQRLHRALRLPDG